MVTKDRQSLYQDPGVQLLLSRFVKGDIVELVPSFDLEHTVRYPEAEIALDGDITAAKQLIEKLWDVGIFKRKFFEKILVCPTCFSANVSNDYVCPNCNSIDIERKTLLEHMSCGTIESVDNFLVEGALVCPRCGKELVEVGIDYQKLGSWFQCSQCGERSDVPNPIHRCRSCGHIFTIRDTGFVSAYTYRLSGDAEEEFKRSHVLMKPIGAVLEQLGFVLEMPGQVAGRSGVLHRFDTVATKGSAVVVLDLIASDKQIEEAPVASLYAKVFDVAPSRAFLIAIPSLSDRARKLAGLYRMSTIEAGTSQIASLLLKDKFDWAGLSEIEDADLDLPL